ncbi:hypothetical protein F1737_00505 [Methanoplanus sp. FWC-SCC4]|uniref:Uncharacterized protein n=1 Tax=Methanochimaera problematica TaxID=2609417 RepID=A0AA97FA94_9EURY|nr:hypothetical protein [Methanoplanus sp. FWC-SCC4]WOF15264.1 hypothetical protein F1737_00505 [Methanoplanus sp. FWC-SCC4]
MNNLFPIGLGLKEELCRYGEFVGVNSFVDPDTGKIWRKMPDGRLDEITKDPEKVLLALEHYGMNVEKRRERCRKGREEWFGQR